MVASMIGNHHSSQTVTFGDTAGYCKHDTIAEWHHRGFHVLVVIVAFRYVIGSHQQSAFEIAVHEFKRDNDVFDTQALTVCNSAHTLATVLRGAIVEGDGHSNFVFVLVEHCGGVHTSGDNDYRVFRHKNCFEVQKYYFLLIC